MVGTHHYLGFDIYGIFDLPTTATPGEVIKRYRRLQLYFMEDKVKQRNGGIFTPSDKVRGEDIKAAYEIFEEDFINNGGSIDKNNWANVAYHKRRRIARYDDITDTTFYCFECPRVDVTRHNGHRSTISFRWFCCQAHAQKWEADRGYTPETFGAVKTFLDGAGGGNNNPPPPPNPTRNCPACHEDKPWKDNGKYWQRYQPGGEACCSNYCLANYLTGQGVNFKKCEFCWKVKAVGSGGASDWSAGDWTKVNGKLYCCEEHSRQTTSGGDMGWSGDGSGNTLQAEKDAAITAVNNSLDQEPKVANFELEIANQSWRQDIENANDLPTITAIKNRVLADIQSKRNAKKGDSSDPLQSLKNSAIVEIDAELSKDPEIQNSELDSDNRNWGADIQIATSENQISQIKDKVLADIKQKRQTKKQGGGGGSDQSQVLNNLRREAINQIKTELGKQPSIDKSEITNQNWEADIAEAQTESAIKEIRDQVLADIINKRATKQEKNLLNELLTQAKQEANWNNYEKLEAILKQIKEFRSSNAYKEKEQQIQEIESKLRELSPDKFKETTKDNLDEQIKNNGLTDSNMDEETKAAVTEAKQNPTPEKVAQAEEKIAQNGAKNDLKNFINKIESKLKRGNLTKKEKEKLVTEILQFITKNNYQVMAYEKQKHKVDKLLAELRGEKSQDNTQNSSFWKKALVPLLIISLLGVMITSILIWRRKRLKRKGGWK